MSKNFALIGCAGYIAPRHMKAIKETGNNLVVAMDPSDSVGILDKYFPDASYFSEFERFERHAEKLKRMGENKRIHYVSICSPNYLHDAHIRFAMRNGSDVICEKPVVLRPWNLDAIIEVEKETGRTVNNVLQMRKHPEIIKLKKQFGESDKVHEVSLDYITPRGKWYDYSWKGDEDKSGGIVTNLGIHLFDILTWVFGSVNNYNVLENDSNSVRGDLELEKANVKWYLSTDKEDLSKNNLPNDKPYRSMKIDGMEIDFSNVSGDLHTEVYRSALEGKGYRIEDCRKSIELVHKIREAMK